MVENEKARLRHAVISGDTDFVENWLRENDPNDRKNFWNGWSPLHLAIIGSNVDIIEMLLKKGADIEVEDGKGQTPLHLSVLCKLPDAAKTLLEYDADIEAKDNKGRTPLDWATKIWYVEIMRILIEAGANLNDSLD